MTNEDRTLLYRWLAKVFSNEFSMEDLQWYRSDAGRDFFSASEEIPAIARPVSHLSSLLTRDDKPVADLHFELVRSFNRLYNNGASVRSIPPYESFYREGLLMRNASQKMAEKLQTSGLSLRQPQELPDHISVELEFMAHLTQDDSEEGMNRQREFLQQHLSWLPGFCADCRDRNEGGVYAATAEILMALLEADRVALAAPLSVETIVHS